MRKHATRPSRVKRTAAVPLYRSPVAVLGGGAVALAAAMIVSAIVPSGAAAEATAAPVAAASCNAGLLRGRECRIDQIIDAASR